MREPVVDWLKTAHLVMLSRELDHVEEEHLAPTGKVKFQFSAQGHELAQVLLAQALDHPHDAAAVYYRSRPFMLASGLSVTESLAAGMARQGSPSQGRDAGVIYNLPPHSGLTVLPASGDVGTQYTPAAGWAQAITYRQHVLNEQGWGGALAVALGGDGSIAANGFWSALTIATTSRLPLLFFIEDNRYGISVSSHLQTPGGDIATNLAAFHNLKVLNGDGCSPGEAWDLISIAVSFVRSGEGPCLLRLQVPRLRGHTFIDDQAYKSEDERTAEAGNDPLDRLRDFNLAQGVMTADDWEKVRKDARQQIEDALFEAENMPDPDPSQVTHHLFYSGTIPQQGGLRSEGALLPLGDASPSPHGPRINLIDAVRRTLESEMRRNSRLLVFGEDVGLKGGVHGATLDMQKHFGVQRVFDTSLSEEGIIGRSVGLALAGLLPVPEIQFRKYADPAYEQINDLGTLRWRTANRFAAPVVVRIPVGYGKKTGDPWHSVTGEAIYAHTLGWRIAFPSNAEDAVGLLRSALRGDDPTFFFEHRSLLDTAESRRPYPGDDFCLEFGKAAIISEGDELTVITWGEVVHRCALAAAAFPGRVTLIDLRTIVPWDKSSVLEHIRQNGKALIVHEDTLTAGFGAEIAAVIAEEAFADLDSPIRRLATPDIPIPYSVPLMESVIPDVSRIRTAMRALLDY